jgi:hypothetical protein
MMAYVTGATILSQTTGTPKSGDATHQKVKYRIAKSYRTVTSPGKEYQVPPTLVVLISIEASHFNEADMTILGKQLNNDFSLEPRLGVFIFSSYDAAKRFTPSEESPDYWRSWKAFRGSYHLDRARGEESISFSTDPSTPQIRRTVVLQGNSSADRHRLSQIYDGYSLRGVKSENAGGATKQSHVLGT